MSKRKQTFSQVNTAGHFVFVRFWLGWHNDCAFPFEKFNALADGEIGDALETYAKQWLSANPENPRLALANDVYFDVLTLDVELL